MVETDASDYVAAGILSQLHGDVWKPVAYFLKKMSPAECNYEIYDKELLAVVKPFELWSRPVNGPVSRDRRVIPIPTVSK